MTEMCDLLLRYAADAHALEHDPVVQAAAQRWIEVLGEAASHVSDELKATHPEGTCRVLEPLLVFEVAVTSAESDHGRREITDGLEGRASCRLPPAMRFLKSIALDPLDQGAHRLPDHVVVVVTDLIDVDEVTTQHRGQDFADS